MTSIDIAVLTCSAKNSLLYKKPSVGTNINITTIVGKTKKQMSNRDSARFVKYSGKLALCTTGRLSNH